jgi:hypothetical protein
MPVDRVTTVLKRPLVETINAELGEQALDSQRLNAAFDRWWPQLEEKLNSVPGKPDTEPAPKARTEESKIDELLGLVRSMQSLRPIAGLGRTPAHDRIAAITNTADFPSIAALARPFLKQLLFPLANAKGRLGQNEAVVEVSLIGPAMEQGLIQAKEGIISLTDLGWAVVEYHT